MAAGPVTLTRAQFAATPVGSKPGAKYGNYLAFIKARRSGPTPPAPHPAAPVDPFAPTTPGQINAATNRITGMYGTPLTDPQITAAAQAQIDPLIAALTAKVTKQTGDASHAIGVNSAALAKALSAIDYGAPYRGAESDQAAVDAALQQSLNGGGSALSADLKSRLGQIDDPTVGAAGDALASRGTALGTTELARGSASLSNLIANAAAAKEYGQKEPGIAGLAGLQGIAGVQKQGTDAIATQTAAILQQLPQIVQSLRAENTNIRGNRASAAEQLLETLTGQNITKATAKAGLVNDQTNSAITAANDNTRNAISQQNADTAAHRADVAARAAAAKAAKEAKGPQLSANEVQHYRGIALTIAQQAKTGAPAVTDANGKVTKPALPKLTYHQALIEMEKEGVPVKIAVATANRVYGKPLTPAQKRKQDAAVASGLGLPESPFSQALTGGR